MSRCPDTAKTSLRDGAARIGRAALLGSTFLIPVGAGVPAWGQLAPNARPQGGQVVAGAASITSNATTTTISQTTRNAAINWNSFNVGSAQQVQFQQPSTTSITLNRVNSPDPSHIAGRITANGQIVLTNPAGVVFTKGASVSAQSFIVSTAGISDANLMAGRMVFDQAGKPGAKISNAGSITVREAGLAALVAPQVRNSGVITATLGHVVLGGAETHTLDLYGDGLVSFDVTGQVRQAPAGKNGKSAAALVTNTGTIRADGGTVLLTASAADGVVQKLVTAGGKISAPTAGSQTGTIVIGGTGGSLIVDGSLAARGTAPDTPAGKIQIAGTGDVILTPKARVTASGAAGGGTIAIGTTLARASGGPSVTPTLVSQQVKVAKGARIAADASNRGNGGTVALLSSGTTDQAGAITARGGPSGGDGGAVEISGATLGGLGAVDVSARGADGADGAILLDPQSLTVIHSAGPTGSLDGTADIPFNTSPAAATVSDFNINSLELTGHVTLSATDSLVVNGIADPGGAVSISAPRGLSLLAGNSIAVHAGASIIANGGTLNAGENGTPFDMANAGIVIAGTIANIDTIRAAGGGINSAAGTIDYLNGSIGMFSAGPVTVGPITAGGSVAIEAAGPATLGPITSGGNIYFVGTAPGQLLTLQGALATTGGTNRVIGLSADEMSLAGGSISAPNVQLAASQEGPVGVNAAGLLQLGVSDLSVIKSNALLIGATDKAAMASAVKLGPLDFTGITQTLDIAASDAITQTGPITVSNFGIGTTALVDLPLANRISTLEARGLFNNVANLTLNSVTDLQIEGSLFGNAASISSDGGIAVDARLGPQTLDLAAAAGPVAINVPIGSPVAIQSLTITAGPGGVTTGAAGSITGNGNAVIATSGSVTLGRTSVPSLQMNIGGTLVQTGPLAVGTLGIASALDVDLGLVNQIGTLASSSVSAPDGRFALRSATPLAVAGTISADNTTITSAGLVLAPGASFARGIPTLDSSAGITVNAPVTTPGITMIATGVDAASNAITFGGNGSLNANGPVLISAAGPALIGPITSTGNIDVFVTTPAQPLTLAGALVSTGRTNQVI
ncbi:MAG TPA: filamentous hemagglutinin N-terminal domain-containing protein, partial [Acetobacteraceae bacterium]|nr:filamentous hemagglutinin N-terminal domain-containing protein [Acetobacteraceae bacterium]